MGLVEKKFKEVSYFIIIAHDIYAILVSTIPSESAFDIGVRVLSPQRSCLKLEMLEALICTQNELYVDSANDNDDNDALRDLYSFRHIKRRINIKYRKSKLIAFVLLIYIIYKKLFSTTHAIDPKKKTNSAISYCIAISIVSPEKKEGFNTEFTIGARWQRGQFFFLSLQALGPALAHKGPSSDIGSVRSGGLWLTQDRPCIY